MKILAAAVMTLAFLGAVFTGVFLMSRPSDAGGPAPAPITAPAVPSSAAVGAPDQASPDPAAPVQPPEPIPAAPLPPAPAPDGSVQPPPLPYDDDWDDDWDDDDDD